MRILRHTDKDFTRSLAALNRRSLPNPKVEQTVREILAAIGERGDAALIEYTEKFGGPKLTPATLLEKRKAKVDTATAEAIARNIRPAMIPYSIAVTPVSS